MGKIDMPDASQFVRKNEIDSKVSTEISKMRNK